MEHQEVLQNPVELGAEALDSVNGGTLGGDRCSPFKVGDMVCSVLEPEYGVGVVLIVFNDSYPYYYDVNFSDVNITRRYSGVELRPA